MFTAGDYVVCPGHGVGQVLEKKDSSDGSTMAFYSIKILSNGMKVMIPTTSKDGMRKLCGSTEITEVFSLLNDHSVDVDNSTWNRRCREYMNKIKTGSLLEIADVLRSLFLLKETKNLSFGEKKMLDQCKDLLVEEISLSTGRPRGNISGEIEACFSEAN